MLVAVILDTRRTSASGTDTVSGAASLAHSAAASVVTAVESPQTAHRMRPGRRLSPPYSKACTSTKI